MSGLVTIIASVDRPRALPAPPVNGNRFTAMRKMSRENRFVRVTFTSRGFRVFYGQVVARYHCTYSIVNWVTGLFWCFFCLYYFFRRDELFKLRSFRNSSDQLRNSISFNRTGTDARNDFLPISITVLVRNPHGPVGFSKRFDGVNTLEQLYTVMVPRSNTNTKRIQLLSLVNSY